MTANSLLFARVAPLCFRAPESRFSGFVIIIIFEDTNFLPIYDLVAAGGRSYLDQSRKEQSFLSVISWCRCSKLSFGALEDGHCHCRWLVWDIGHHVASYFAFQAGLHTDRNKAINWAASCSTNFECPAFLELESALSNTSPKQMPLALGQSSILGLVESYGSFIKVYLIIIEFSYSFEDRTLLFNI